MTPVRPSVVATPGASDYPVAAAVFALALAAVHLTTGRWEFVHAERRRWFLSAGGGASVAYVFVLVLPEVSEAAIAVGELRREAFLADQLVFLVALVGFVAFYGVEVFATQRRGEAVTDAGLSYRLHVVTFATYSGVIGYLLFHQEAAGLLNLLFYAVAMALHFGVTDYGLHRHYGDAFDRTGKVLLAGGTLVGAAIGFVTEIGAFPLAMVFAFLAGAIVFNVVKEELPTLTDSRFAAFVTGALVFVVLLLLT